MKRILMIMAVIGCFLIAGCSSQESAAPPTLLSAEEGRYSFLFIFEESTPIEETSTYTNEVLDKAMKKDLLYGSTITTQAAEFGLEVESYPVIVIMDSREIVLKAYSEKEAIAFLEDQ